MLVTIQAGERQAHFDLEVTVTWTAQRARSYGRATLLVPRSSRAWSAGVLRPEGGMLVRLDDGGQRWLGIAEVPVWRPEGAELTVLDAMSWVRTRLVGSGRTLRGLTAGAIVRVALRDAFGGLGAVPLRPGRILEAPPIIPLFHFRAQSVEDVMAELQQLTGHEWALDPATLEVHWQASTGRYHEGLFVDLEHLVERLQPGTLADRAREVVEVDRAGRTATAWNLSTPPLWPSQQRAEVQRG